MDIEKEYEENVMEFERKYGTEFTEFDDRIKREGASLLESLKI